MTEDEIGLLVIQEAKKILHSENCWNHDSEYGEQCLEKSIVFSLGCAMEKAQLIHRSEKKNRSREMSLLRRKIYRHYFWRAGIHPISYFNKHHKTTYEEVIDILNKVEKKL